MDDRNMNGMGGMSQPSTMNNPMVMSQMTFFWSKNAYILFSGWPGTSTGMYVLALIFIFVLSIFVEWLSHCQLIKPGPKHVVVGVVQTILHALRVCLDFFIMLAVRSFNGGVFLVAVAGHTVGFLLFGSRVFKDSDAIKFPYDPHPLSC